MITRFLRLFLALSLAASVLSACGGTGDETPVRNLSTEEQAALTDTSAGGETAPDDPTAADEGDVDSNANGTEATPGVDIQQEEVASGTSSAPEEKDPLDDISDGIDWETEGPGGGDLDQHVVDVWELPSLDSVTVESTPLLYDFLNSCLDWHVSINRESAYSDFYILRNLNHPTYIYTDYYIVSGDEITLPPCGGEILPLELRPEQASAIVDVVEKMPSERVFQEGDYQLLCLQRNSEDGITGFGPDDTWATLTPRNFGVLYVYSEGNPRPFLENGEGWPTEWLRREPYASGLTSMGLNMTQSWWDDFRYQGKYRMEPMSNTVSDEYSGTLTCIGYEKFNFDRDDGFSSQNVDWSNIIRLCDTEGYEVVGKYTPVLSD